MSGRGRIGVNGRFGRFRSECLLVTVLVALLCGGAAARSLVEEARAIAGRAEDIARLWPGFWPAEQAFVLYRRDGECVMYSPLETPAGFDAVEEAQRQLWRGHCTGSAFKAPILLAGEVGGVEAVGVLVEALRIGVPEFLLHEAFHAFQRTRFERRDSAGPDLNAFDFPADEDWMRWKLREALLLMEAVAKEEPPARHALIHLVLALRESRLQAMPAAAGELEDHYMRWEGTASYVERRLRGEVASADTARALAVEVMKGAISFAPWEFLLRVQSYYTGAAAGLLLDELGFADWQQRVMSGEPLYGLLAEATGYLGRNASVLRELAGSLRMDGLDSLVKRMRRNAGLIRVAEKRYSRAARHWLLVDLSQAAESSFQAAGMVGTSDALWSWSPILSSPSAKPWS